MKEIIDLKETYGKKKTIPFQPGINNSRDDKFATIIFPFDRELWDELQVFSQKHDSILFLTLLTAFRVLLYRYSYENDIYIANTIGKISLLNRVLFRSETNGETCFDDLLRQVNDIVVQSNNKSPDDPGEDEFCKILFKRQQMTEFSKTGPVPIQVGFDHSEFDLAFNIADSTNPYGIINFVTDSYTPDTIQQMIVHYKQLLISILNEPKQKIGKLPMLTPTEEHELLEVFNDTAKPYFTNKTIVDLFERQVDETPDNIALHFDDDTITYAALNKRANQLANHLRALGVKKEDNVGLLATRNFDMIIGLYAILKAGAAYVPVEPGYPIERQQYMLSKSAVKLVVTNIEHSLGDLGIEVIDMRTVNYNDYSSENLHVDVSSKQLAYTIYTSGSTGVPKGVMIEHHSVVNLITWVNKEFNVGSFDRLLFVTSFCFDLSVYDVFGMLSAGGSLVIASREDVLKIPKLIDLLEHYQITFWDSVPTTMDYLASRLASAYPDYNQNALRVVFLSGDWIPVSLPERIRNHFPGANVISLGGATEATVWSNYYPIKKVHKEWHSIPYGKPITNNAFYILNEQLQPVPTGVKGELYIGGVGVARGYANDHEKTARAFLPDPFTDKWGGKMYKTGDLGRMLPDGNMELIGRKDNQVKLRGHRIELSEIECVIREYDSVENAVVLHHEDKKQLIAYIIPGKNYDREIVIGHLIKKLPDYMIPAKWVELESMPLTGNGKTDTKALRDIDTRSRLNSEFIAPRNELERTLVILWQQISGIHEIGIHDNFFDNGLQSLLAVELIMEIEKKMGTSLPVNILYKHPTIALLGSYLQENILVNKWKSLVAIKSSGYKMPLYIVHGDGLSLSNFQNLAEHIDINQPVFSLQPQGLNGVDAPLESIEDIARLYISEILEHNPTGPYALAGYSFGGYVAIEMKKQLEAISKKVKMLAIFDTNAENMIYKGKKEWAKTLPRRIIRQVPKFIFIVKSMLNRPAATMRYQYVFFTEKINRVCYKLGIKEKPELKGVNINIERINETHLKAFKNFDLTPFHDKIHLFKAKSRLYYVDDGKYLGWTNYALSGVNVYEVPGDHRTIFSPPNVSELARLLQNALDNC